MRIGDVVKLKSGGPKMTVTSDKESDTFADKIWVTWMYRGERREAKLPIDALVRFRKVTGQ